MGNLGDIAEVTVAGPKIFCNRYSSSSKNRTNNNNTSSNNNNYYYYDDDGYQKLLLPQLARLH